MTRQRSRAQRREITARAVESFAALGKAHRRLEHLYEISKLFARFENLEQTFDPALAIAARTLPIRSAVLIETENGQSTMIVWPSEGQERETLRAIKEHVEAAYSYLIGPSPDGPQGFDERVGSTVLPRPAAPEHHRGKRFIVIPLVIAHHAPFGALQLEGARPLEKPDLIFVNALANQLAVALDRHRAWRRDIARREHAETERTHADARTAVAEHQRFVSEGLLKQSEVLALENARLYEQAQRAVAVREQILAVVSHDLRNPLAIILLATGLLATGRTDAERLKGLPERAARIQRAAERMQRMIEDLLDFAAIEAGRLAMIRRPCAVGPILRETLIAFQAGAKEKGLHLTAEVERRLPKLSCDRDRLFQVFLNLVGNAIKATASGGRVTLRVERRGGAELLFSVSDSGPGISAEDVKHLFERYWRGDEANYRGTGLGLAIARGIVVAHGGQIWVETEVGHGATFLFTIPLTDVRLGVA